MQIHQNMDKNVYIIALQGKLVGFQEVEELNSHIRQLKEQNINRVILNLQYLDWLGSIGLGALISFMTTMRNMGGDVRLSNLNEKLRSLLNMTKLDQVFQIFETVDLAVQSYIATTH